MIAVLMVLSLLATDPYVQDGWQSPPPPPPVETTTTTTQALEPAADRGMGNNTEQWRPLVAGHFPPDQVNTALCVMAGESGGNPDAYNPSGASGLFQVMPFWARHYGVSRDDLFTPEINVYIASRIYAEEGGWKHWSVWKKGRCRNE